MFIFGHIGITFGVINLFYHVKRNNYKLVILGSLLPDIIDKNLNLLVFNTFSGRFIGHYSFLPLLFFILIYIRTQFAIIGFAIQLHLLEDGIIVFIPESIFWHKFTLCVPQLIIPNTFISEIIGLLLIIYFIIKSKLTHDWRSFEFL